MSLSEQTPRVDVTLVTATDAIPFPYPFADDDELYVVSLADGQVLASGYTVSGAGDSAGGTVTMIGGTIGDDITILRQTPKSQLLTLRTNGKFFVEDLETALDKLTKQGQELNENINRCIQSAVTNSGAQVIPDNEGYISSVGMDASGALTSTPRCSDGINRSMTKSVQAGDEVSYLTIPHNANLSIGTGDFTVISWIKIPDSPTYDNIILSKEGGSTGILFRVQPSGGISCTVDGTSFDGGNIDDAEWHMIAMSFDRSEEKVYKYIDGYYAGYQPFSKVGVDIDNTGDLRVLGDGNLGSIREGQASGYVVITTDVVTASEMIAIASDRHEAAGLDNLILCMDLETGVEGSFPDRSPNAATATIVGSLTYRGFSPQLGGTVTSVAASGSDGIEVDSGSPITGSGTIALGLNKTTTLATLNVEDGADATDETNVVAALSGATLTDAGTPAGTDKVLIQDTSDGDNLKYVNVNDLPSSGGGGGGYTDGQIDGFFASPTTNTGFVAAPWFAALNLGSMAGHDIENVGVDIVNVGGGSDLGTFSDPWTEIHGDYGIFQESLTVDGNNVLAVGDNANTLGATGATDGHVLTADGAGGAAWEAASGGGGGLTAEEVFKQQSETIKMLPSHFSSGTEGTGGSISVVDPFFLQLRHVAGADGGAFFYMDGYGGGLGTNPFNENSFNAIDFSKQIRISLRINPRDVQGDSEYRLKVGQITEGALETLQATDKAVAVILDSSGNVYLEEADGTDVNRSASLGTMGNSGVSTDVLSLYIDGTGNASVLKNGTTLGSITGVYTGVASSAAIQTELEGINHTSNTTYMTASDFTVWMER